MRRLLGYRTWINRLTGPRKGTRDHSMPVKRRQVRSANRTLREIRATWLRLDCLKSNPDRVIRHPRTEGRGTFSRPAFIGRSPWTIRFGACAIVGVIP